MINNWNYKQLHMDYSGIFDDGHNPSDIDIFNLYDDGTLLLGEIKSERGQFKDGQRRLLQKVLDSHDGDAVGIYVEHDKLVQNGDVRVGVADCPVKLIYIKGEWEWRPPKTPAKVRDVLRWFDERAKGKY